ALERLDQGREGLVIHDIEPLGTDLRPERTTRFGAGAEALRVAPGEGEAHARPRISARERAADAAACSGDQNRAGVMHCGEPVHRMSPWLAPRPGGYS